jgi:threonine/homoserine/homoserine lactone efflux protein
MLPEWPTLMVFIGATLALLLTPGPAVLYIVARSIDQGRAAGLVSSLGMTVGALFHVTAAALGLSALLVSSAAAFAAVKYVGAVYLVYLGLRRLASPGEPTGLVADRNMTLRRIFGQAVLVNLLNPKTAMFFLAFLPQFTDPGRGSLVLQILMLGAILVGMGLICDMAWALGAGTARESLRNSIGFVRGQRYVAGSVFIALGLYAALSGHRHASE